MKKKGILQTIISSLLLLTLIGGVVGIIYIYKSSNGFTTNPNLYGFSINDNLFNDNLNYYVSNTIKHQLILNKKYSIKLKGIESDVDYDIRFIANPDSDFQFINGEETLNWKNTPKRNEDLNNYFNIKDYKTSFEFSCVKDWKQIIKECYPEAVINEYNEYPEYKFRLEITNQSTIIYYDFKISEMILMLDTGEIIW